MLSVLLCLPALSVAFADDNELPASVRSVLQVRDLPTDSLSIYVEDLQTGCESAPMSGEPSVIV